jgi:hypothetical protein
LASVNNALLGGMLFSAPRDPGTDSRSDEHRNGKGDEYDDS